MYNSRRQASYACKRSPNNQKRINARRFLTGAVGIFSNNQNNTSRRRSGSRRDSFRVHLYLRDVALRRCAKFAVRLEVYDRPTRKDRLFLLEGEGDDALNELAIC